MSEADVTAYIQAQDEPKRSTLEAMRSLIMEIDPSFEQVIAWNAPLFKLNGKYVAGLCAFKNHLTFSPQSATVMESHATKLEGFVTSKSSFQFAVDQPLPRELVMSLVAARVAEIA